MNVKWIGHIKPVYRHNAEFLDRAFREMLALEVFLKEGEEATARFLESDSGYVEIIEKLGSEYTYLTREMCYETATGKMGGISQNKSMVSLIFAKSTGSCMIIGKPLQDWPAALEDIVSVKRIGGEDSPFGQQAGDMELVRSIQAYNAMVQYRITEHTEVRKMQAINHFLRDAGYNANEARHEISGLLLN